MTAAKKEKKKKRTLSTRLSFLTIAADIAPPHKDPAMHKDFRSETVMMAIYVIFTVGRERSHYYLFKD